MTTEGKYYESEIILPEEQRCVLISNALVHDLLNAEFKTEKRRIKPKQGEVEKEEVIDRAFFCVSCRGGSLTNSEINEFHNGHQILRTRKCSGCYGYVNYEIISVLQEIIHDIDLSGVYEFKTNDYYIYFPKSRKKSHNKKINNMMIKGRCCIKCTHTLPEGYSFCSIECKITCTNDDLQRHNDLVKQLAQNQVTLPSKNTTERTTAKEGNNNINKKKLKIDLEGFATISRVEETDGKKLSNDCGYSYRTRNRKGIPNRAPLY